MNTRTARGKPGSSSSNSSPSLVNRMARRMLTANVEPLLHRPRLVARATAAAVAATAAVPAEAPTVEAGLSERSMTLGMFCASVCSVDVAQFDGVNAMQLPQLCTAWSADSQVISTFAMQTALTCCTLPLLHSPFYRQNRSPMQGFGVPIDMSWSMHTTSVYGINQRAHALCSRNISATSYTAECVAAGFQIRQPVCQ